jgi:sulfotransferase
MSEETKPEEKKEVVEEKSLETDKKICFLSGLPRAGSTIIQNCLGQNPRFHVTGTSGILEILYTVRNRWNTVSEFMADTDRNTNETQRNNVLRGILFNYFHHVEQPVIFDKSRGWLAFMEMAKLLLKKEPKVLVPVRDLRDILASFEKLYRRTSENREVAQAAPFYLNMQTALGRCDVMIASNMPVGIAMDRLMDAVTRGWNDKNAQGDCLKFIEYDRFCRQPKRVMEEIYEFIDEPYHDHDFENVDQVTHEFDDWYGWSPDLHKIRPKIQEQEPQWPIVFDKPVTRSDFWKTSVEKYAQYWIKPEARTPRYFFPPGQQK